MNQEAANGPLAGLLKILSKIEPREIKATGFSFSLVFILMAAYYILRRCAMLWPATGVTQR